MQAIAYSRRFPRFSKKIGNGNKTHLEAMELYHRDQIDALERVLGDSTYKFVEVDKASVVVVVAGVAVVLKKKLVKSLQAIAYSPRFTRFSQK